MVDPLRKSEAENEVIEDLVSCCFGCLICSRISLSKSCEMVSYNQDVLKPSFTPLKVQVVYVNEFKGLRCSDWLKGCSGRSRWLLLLQAAANIGCKMSYMLLHARPIESVPNQTDDSFSTLMTYVTVETIDYFLVELLWEY